MTTLVTGAAGYLGNNVVRRLVEKNRPVRALVHNTEKAKIRLGQYGDKVDIVQGSVTDRERVRDLMKDVDTVIHLVAIALERGGQTYEDVNFQGTINLVDAATDFGVNRFIYMSQNGASSDHDSRFLRSKGKAQDYVTESGLRWTVLRPSAIFGPQDEFFNSIARLVKVTPLLFPLIGGGGAKFQPVSVDDVVEAIIRSTDDEGTIGKIFGLGGPEVLTLGEIERRIIKQLGRDKFTLLIPAPTALLRLPVFVMEKTLPGSPVNGNLLDLLAVPNVIEHNALVEYFKMQPIPFSDDHIAYLNDNSIGDTFRKFFRNATVN